MVAYSDVFIRLEPPAASLKTIGPRGSLYHVQAWIHFLSACLKWDLCCHGIQWRDIAMSDIPADKTVGLEDSGKVVGNGEKAKNRFAEKWVMYDYPGTNGRCSQLLVSSSLLPLASVT